MLRMRKSENYRKPESYHQVYVLHYLYPDKTIKHYIGFSALVDSDERFRRHLRGNGSHSKAALKAGAKIVRVSQWFGYGMELERALQILQERDVSNWCHVCSGVKQYMAEEIIKQARNI